MHLLPLILIPHSTSRKDHLFYFQGYGTTPDNVGDVQDAQSQAIVKQQKEASLEVKVNVHFHSEVWKGHKE